MIKPQDIKAGEYIYWRWKGEKVLSKSFVQKFIGDIVCLTNSRWHDFPQRVLMSEIEIHHVEKDNS